MVADIRDRTAYLLSCALSYLSSYSIPSYISPPSIAPIQCIAWHCSKKWLALGLKNGVVQIQDMEDGQGVSLWCEFQRGITNISWRPNATNSLVVSTSGGTFLWSFTDDGRLFKKAFTSRSSTILSSRTNIIPSHLASPFPSPASISTSPNIWVTPLPSSGIEPTTCVEWSPCGRFLVLGSSSRAGIAVWDVDMGVCTPMYAAGGTTELKWSPNGMYLFQGTTSRAFRVWDTRSWTCIKWTNLPSHCQSGAWGAGGAFLLVGSRDKVFLFGIESVSKNGTIGMRFEGVESVAAHDSTMGNAAVRIGGHIRHLRWDPSSERLAISFVSSPLIAIYRTRITASTVELAPLGLVRSRTASSIYAEAADADDDTPQRPPPPSDSEPCTVVDMCFRLGLGSGASLAVCTDDGAASCLPFEFSTKPTWSW
eukprot:TRINITY_DN9073_c0_g1_i5.p1 TRINITY_DN9073_c0_g1~~TRINITY_DN9073_c0_g1_i5.p1  ORF type:complete len:424 (-),score=10.20 TRINITY_DN9073_c0_g1_i5:48-1319(-)